MLRIAQNFVIAAALALFALPAFSSQPEDAWITTKVKMNLLTADGIDDPMQINVDTVDGVVTLHGPVYTAEEKRQSQARASSINGVREVRNLLAVVSEPARKQVEASDDQLRDRVETVLERDKALDNSQIKIKSITNGTVLLSGKADTLTAHRRALEDARAVDGVRKVASEISSPDELGDKEIWSDEPVVDSASNGASDTWITAKSKVRLMAEPGLSPFSINVDTRGGVVTLFGIVGTAQAKQAAEREVKQIAGVKGVENQLQVVADVAMDKVEAQDDQLLDAVKKRLEEREALADSNIDVEVKKGVVRLTGTVASQGDRITALTVARSTKGVASIIDDLRLEQRKG